MRLRGMAEAICSDVVSKSKPTWGGLCRFPLVARAQVAERVGRTMLRLIVRR